MSSISSSVFKPPPLSGKFILFLCCAIWLTACDTKQKELEAAYDTFFAEQIKLADRGDMNTAMRAIDSLYAATPVPIPYLRYQRMGFKCRYFYYSDKKDSARLAVDSSIYLMELYNLAQKYPSNYAWALYQRGDYYFTDGKIDSAFTYFSRSREISLANNNQYLIGRESYHLGMITYRQQRFAEAADYFKDAFVSISKLHKSDSFHYYWLQEILNNAALSYTKIDSLDSARLYYTRALNYVKVEGGKFSYSPRQKKMAEVAIGVITGNLAKVYIAQQHFDTAEALLRQSIEINSRPGYDGKDAVSAKMQLAELYYKQHRLPETHDLLMQVRQTLVDTPIADLDLRSSELLSYYYLDSDEPEMAVGFMKLHRKLKDSVTSVEDHIKKADYTHMLVQQDTRFQVKLLQKSAELQNIFLWFTAGLVFLLGIILLLIVQGRRKDKRNLAELTALNNRINHQNTVLERTLKELRRSNEHKDRILRIVAHDLRSPVGIVLSISSFMMEDEKDAEKRRTLDMIVRASRGVVELSEELLEFSDEGEELSMVGKETVDVGEVATQTIGLLQFNASKKNQLLKLAVPAEPAYVHAYRDKIARIFSNLISNAIKFSPEKSEIDIQVVIKEKNVLIQVKDQGIGIPFDMQPQIFEPFTSAKRNGTAGEKSYGLGLSICRHIAEIHNGRIWVKSAPGEGSTFFVELPLI